MSVKNEKKTKKGQTANQRPTKDDQNKILWLKNTDAQTSGF